MLLSIYIVLIQIPDLQDLKGTASFTSIERWKMLFFIILVQEDCLVHLHYFHVQEPLHNLSTLLCLSFHVSGWFWIYIVLNQRPGEWITKCSIYLTIPFIKRQFNTEKSIKFKPSFRNYWKNGYCLFTNTRNMLDFIVGIESIATVYKG